MKHTQSNMSKNKETINFAKLPLVLLSRNSTGKISHYILKMYNFCWANSSWIFARFWDLPERECRGGRAGSCRARVPAWGWESVSRGALGCGGSSGRWSWSASLARHTEARSWTWYATLIEHLEMLFSRKNRDFSTSISKSSFSRCLVHGNELFL